MILFHDQSFAGLESRRLRYFIAVAEQLHYGRAADQLQIAQSALSRHIQELERQLGVRLLNRGRRSVISLTESGKALLAEGLLGTQQLARAVRAARRAAEGEIGRVAVGYVASASLSGVLPRTLERFRIRHENVSVLLNQMETPLQLDALRDGLLDVGYIRPRKTYPTGVLARVVYRETMLLAIAANHPLAAKRIELKHLANQTFIIPQVDEDTGFAEQMAQMASHGGFEPKAVLHVRDFLTALSLAGGGYGVVPAPRCMLSINVRNVVLKTIQGYTGTVELAVAYRSSPASAAVAAFVRETAKP
jgi:LysR family transcriptional regulator, benzoate and cis,cis-muconate-responsive activator of ben and cat genes